MTLECCVFHKVCLGKLEKVLNSERSFAVKKVTKFQRLEGMFFGVCVYANQFLMCFLFDSVLPCFVYIRSIRLSVLEIFNNRLDSHLVWVLQM